MVNYNNSGESFINNLSNVYPISPRCYYTTIVVSCVYISKHKLCIKISYVAATFRDVVAIFR